MPTWFVVACALLGPALSAAGAAPDPLAPAEALLARGDTSAAVDWLTRTYRGIDGPGGYLLLGRLHRESGDIGGRLRSQRVLEEARARFPRHLDVRMELGRTYFAQGFFPSAVACFKGVLAGDPRRCEASYLLGLYYYRNWKRMNEYRDDRDAARRELRAALACDTTNADAAFRYLVTCYAAGDTSAVESTRWVRRFPARGEFWMFRGVLAYDAGRLVDCARDFGRGLALLDAAARESYGQVRRILPVTEGDPLDALPPARREAVARGFWVSNDPDPTTVLNEPQLEHVHRMFLADALYSSEAARKRGWETDRGEAYVKFGAPASVKYSLGDDNRNGKIEIWTYLHGGRFQQFLFVDEFLNGNPRIPYAADVALHFMRHAPRHTAFVPDAVRLPGDLDIVAFRDDAMSASVYLAMRIDADSARAVAGGGNIVVRTAWFDPDWNRAGGAEDSVSAAEIPARRVRGAARYDLVRRARVPFEGYRFACAVEHADGGARAVMRGEGDASRFIEGRLALSDILLVAEDGGGGAVIERLGKHLSPRIDRRYDPGDALRAYVEVYNLARVARFTAYDVRFAIHPTVAEELPVWREWTRRLGEVIGLTGDPVVSQTFRRAGRTAEEGELMSIDISMLPPGRYDLVVEVSDAHSRARALVRTPFVKESERVADRKR